MKLSVSAYCQLISLLLICLVQPLRAEPVCEPSYPDQASRECGEVEPISWVASNFEAEIAPTGSKALSVSGGRGPYTWTISGNGFYLDSDYTSKNLTTDSSSVTIYSNNACGSGQITISDTCGSSTGSVRSTNGKWTRIYYNPGGIVNPPITGDCTSDFRPDLGDYHWVVTKGSIKLTQIIPEDWAPPAGLHSREEAKEECMREYNDSLAIGKNNCENPAYYQNCQIAFKGKEYTPCKELPPGVHHYDPMSNESCDQIAFGFYWDLYGDKKIWYTKAHKRFASKTIVEEWQCGN